MSMDRLGAGAVESDGYDNGLPVYCYGQVGMRMIDKRSRYTVIQVGRERNDIWRWPGNEYNGNDNHCNKDRYDCCGRDGSMTPFSLHFL